MVTQTDVELLVIDFLKKEHSLIATIIFKRILVEVDSVLLSNFGFEDISDATATCLKAFNVNYDNFYWSNYFPWKEKGFFSFKEPVQDKTPLTIKMFTESAKAGRWLYD
ncbi:DUF1493 family protein [Yersinia hibernica]|uniref:DUF1493 domain-containing protein n=1 Tax=Yersinia enterocolitica LC20 TaxID=1443113 RepID=A0A7U4GEX5_YEREN|nr:DUF1493 family protein [Yersinia hibernica]AHM73534.1 DUF1493 domain-containing protein [Yersinia hibernica]